MAMDVAIPEMGESVSEVILLEWLKEDGAYVERDEPICVLETDKANVDLPAPAAGVLRHAQEVDATLAVGDTVARLEEGEAKGDGAPAKVEEVDEAEEAEEVDEKAEAEAADADDEAEEPEETKEPEKAAEAEGQSKPDAAAGMGPAARRLVEENDLDESQIDGTGKDGRITKQDVVEHMKSREKAPAKPAPEEKPAPKEKPAAPEQPAAAPPPKKETPQPAPAAEGEGVRREPMSRLRQRIADRLVEAQQTAAILSTFNEIDLSGVMTLRAKHKERFAEVHGVSLGLMSFFSKATALALEAYPAVNASIDGTDVVYHDYVHLGIAVSTERGLLVPVLRHVERLGLAQIEAEIKRLAGAARDNKLGLSELSGATFTITNGGVFGSLLSTPILTPPQSGILGMHAIKERPVAVDGEVAIRPMMYVALSYDHRLVDGQQSVSFLVRLKELLEDPTRLFLEI